MKFKRMCDSHILKLLLVEQYSVDPDTGTVYNKHNRPLKPFHHIRESKHLFVTLFDQGKYRRSISVGRLVWMSVTKELIPKGWEVHHRDEDARNNAWSNLLCLHPTDHLKIHDKKPVPF